MLITRIIMLIKILITFLTSFASYQPMEYYKEEILLNNKPQYVHTLVVNINDPRVSIVNALSFGKIYGFEETSEMVKKNEAAAGVNGMFYTIYGHHIGLLVQDKQLLTMAHEKTPAVAFLDNGEVYMGELDAKVNIVSSDNTIVVDTMNDAAAAETWVLYSAIYGKTTRITRDGINYIIENNKVVDKIVTNEPVNIPQEGYVLSRVTNESDQYDLLKINEPINIETVYTPNIGTINEAFQSGGWLVKDGVNVAKDFELFMGNTRIPNPRTIIGVTGDNKVIIKVIDGRQPEYSLGITGKEAADIMIKDGCEQAVYLDGGASSTMVVKDKVVNSPSSKKERKVAHSLLVYFKLLE